MAYSGFLVKVGDFEIPFSMMSADSYVDVLNSLDMDSSANGNGVLEREVLDTVAPKVVFEIPPMKTDKEINAFFDRIRENYIDKKEKNLMVTSYVSEYGKYVTAEMYLQPSIEFPIYQANKNELKYGAIRLAFTAYGTSIDQLLQ